MIMKKVLCFLLCVSLLLPCLCMGVSAQGGMTYYIDSIDGDDSARGTGERSAWRTVRNLETLALQKGDKVLFRRDGIYNVNCLTLTCKGTAENPIVISAYGEGAKPLLTTNKRTDILHLLDCSYVTVSDLEMTAHNGGGIWIYTQNEESNGVKLDNLTIHDIQNYKVTTRDSQANPTEARACVVVKNLCYPAQSLYRVNDFSMTNCELYDCGNGLLLWGSFTEDSKNPWSEDVDQVSIVYNQNALVENCYFHDMDAEGMIIGMTDNALIRNCRFIDCCQGVGTDENGKVLYYTAPVWYWGGLRSTVESCEIAGAKNFGDGMAVDFDSWTNDCTYQYIYSHDNNCFIVTCPYGTGQSGNTVRYCLSVDDNVCRNSISTGEKNFSFYNNTIINSSNFVLNGIRDSVFANNIIVGDLKTDFFWTRKAVDEQTGESFRKEFTGIFANNCLWGTGVPTCAEKTFVCAPGFVGTDKTNPDSFKLAQNSPLLGKGMTLENMGETDFYGNALTQSHNIGCYDGAGENTKAPLRPFDSLFRLVNTALGTLYQWVQELCNKYWIF